MDKKELDFIIQEGEGQFVEFKESFDKNIAKEMVAFANGYFIAEFKLKRLSPKVTLQVTLTALEEKILSEIRKNNKISRNQLASILGISPSTVKEYLDKLKSKMIIRRVGETSAGYWELMNKKSKVKNELPCPKGRGIDN